MPDRWIAMRCSILSRYPTLASQEDTGRAAGAGVAEKHRPTHRDFEGSWGPILHCALREPIRFSACEPS
jgi:hypothetical protein